jgi:hypothetical protein
LRLATSQLMSSQLKNLPEPIWPTASNGKA